MLSFNRESDLKLADFAEKIGQSMKENAFFTSPPVSMEDLETATREFREAVALKDQSGPMGYRNRDTRREALVRILRKLAIYVQQACEDDLSVLTSSGFAPVIPSNTRVEVEVPKIDTIKQGVHGQLVVRVQPVANAKIYEIRYSAVAGQWQPADPTSDSRRILLSNLIPGTVYNVEVRAVGGLRGASDWSTGAAHMVI